MVKKNGPDILNPRTKLQTTHCKTEKSISFNPNQNIESQEVASLRKKLKKERSLKRISELKNLDAQKHVHRTKAGMHKKTGASVSSSPNYMKPTTSSDARSERQEVSVQTHFIHEKQTPITSKYLGSSSCKSKPAKVLARVLTWKSSLRIVSKTAKKCSGLHLHPKLNASKSTCSSTLKESKFPEELELSPGATEAEGTSTMKVCPYTYCSLNGHKHRPLPSLKSFKTARRRLLKTRKSLKLRGIPSFRKRGLWKSKSQEMDGDFFAKTYTGTRVELEKLIFVENKKEVADDCNASNFSETPSVGETRKERGTTILNRPADGCSSEISFEGNLPHVSDSSVSEKELSTTPGENDVYHDEGESEEPNLLQLQDAKYSEKYNLLHDYDDIEKFSESEAQKIFPEATDMEIGKEMPVYNDIGLADDGSNETISKQREEEAYNKDTHKDLSGDTCESKHANVDETSRCGQVREDIKDYIDGDEYLTSDISAEEDIQMNGNCNGMTEDSANTASGEVYDDVSEQVPESPQQESPDVQGQQCSRTTNNVNFLSFTFTDREKDMLDEAECDTNVGSECTQEVDTKVDAKEATQAESESTWLEATQDLKAVQIGISYPVYGGIERRGENNEVSYTKNTPKIQVSEDGFDEPYQENSEDFVKAKPGSDVGDEITEDMSLDKTYWDFAEKDDIVDQEGTEVCMLDGVNKDSCNKCDSFYYQSDIVSFKGNEKTENVMFQDCKTETVVKSTSSNVLDDGTNHETRMKDYQEPRDNEERLLMGFDTEEENMIVTEIITIPDNFLSETDDEMKARFSITRTRIDEDQEKLKAFNPREPNFLPAEPDPGEEIVDLRHQMMDDRKNAEEWMVDYRLQRVVSSLRPARKSKVELLVDAFEAVKPLPLFEVSPSNGSPFDQVQVTQACS